MHTQPLQTCFKKIIPTFLKSKTEHPRFSFSPENKNLIDFAFRSVPPCTEVEAVFATAS